MVFFGYGIVIFGLINDFPSVNILLLFVKDANLASIPPDLTSKYIFKNLFIILKNCPKNRERVFIIIIKYRL